MKTGNNIVRSMLSDMTGWEMGRDGVLEVSDYFRIYVRKLRSIPGEPSITNEVTEQAS